VEHNYFQAAHAAQALTTSQGPVQVPNAGPLSCVCGTVGVPRPATGGFLLPTLLLTTEVAKS
jgi:hypothetical protein